MELKGNSNQIDSWLTFAGSKNKSSLLVINYSDHLSPGDSTYFMPHSVWRLVINHSSDCMKWLKFDVEVITISGIVFVLVRICTCQIACASPLRVNDQRLASCHWPCHTIAAVKGLSVHGGPGLKSAVWCPLLAIVGNSPATAGGTGGPRWSPMLDEMTFGSRASARLSSFSVWRWRGLKLTHITRKGCSHQEFRTSEE